MSRLTSIKGFLGGLAFGKKVYYVKGVPLQGLWGKFQRRGAILPERLKFFYRPSARNVLSPVSIRRFTEKVNPKRRSRWSVMTTRKLSFRLLPRNAIKFSNVYKNSVVFPENFKHASFKHYNYKLKYKSKKFLFFRVRVFYTKFKYFTYGRWVFSKKRKALKRLNPKPVFTYSSSRLQYKKRRILKAKTVNTKFGSKLLKENFIFKSSGKKGYFFKKFPSTFKLKNNKFLPLAKPVKVVIRKASTPRIFTTLVTTAVASRKRTPRRRGWLSRAARMLIPELRAKTLARKRKRRKQRKQLLVRRASKRRMRRFFRKTSPGSRYKRVSWRYSFYGYRAFFSKHTYAKLSFKFKKIAGLYHFFKTAASWKLKWILFCGYNRAFWVSTYFPVDFSRRKVFVYRRFLKYLSSATRLVKTRKQQILNQKSFYNQFLLYNPNRFDFFISRRLRRNLFRGSAVGMRSKTFVDKRYYFYRVLQGFLVSFKPAFRFKLKPAPLKGSFKTQTTLANLTNFLFQFLTIVNLTQKVALSGIKSFVLFIPQLISVLKSLFFTAGWSNLVLFQTTCLSGFNPIFYFLQLIAPLFKTIFSNFKPARRYRGKFNRVFKLFSIWKQKIESIFQYKPRSEKESFYHMELLFSRVQVLLYPWSEYSDLTSWDANTSPFREARQKFLETSAIFSSLFVHSFASTRWWGVGVLEQNKAGLGVRVTSLKKKVLKSAPCQFLHPWVSQSLAAQFFFEKSTGRVRASYYSRYLPLVACRKEFDKFNSFRCGVLPSRSKREFFKKSNRFAFKNFSYFLDYVYLKKAHLRKLPKFCSLFKFSAYRFGAQVFKKTAKRLRFNMSRKTARILFKLPLLSAHFVGPLFSDKLLVKYRRKRVLNKKFSLISSYCALLGLKNKQNYFCKKKYFLFPAGSLKSKVIGASKYRVWGGAYVIFSKNFVDFKNVEFWHLAKKHSFEKWKKVSAFLKKKYFRWRLKKISRCLREKFFFKKRGFFLAPTRRGYFFRRKLSRGYAFKKFRLYAPKLFFRLRKKKKFFKFTSRTKIRWKRFYTFFKRIRVFFNMRDHEKIKSKKKTYFFYLKSLSKFRNSVNDLSSKITLRKCVSDFPERYANFFKFFFFKNLGFKFSRQTLRYTKKKQQNRFKLLKQFWHSRGLSFEYAFKNNLSRKNKKILFLIWPKFKHIGFNFFSKRGVVQKLAPVFRFFVTRLKNKLSKNFKNIRVNLVCCTLRVQNKKRFSALAFSGARGKRASKNKIKQRSFFKRRLTHFYQTSFKPTLRIKLVYASIFRLYAGLRLWSEFYRIVRHQSFVSSIPAKPPVNFLSNGFNRFLARSCEKYSLASPLFFRSSSNFGVTAHSSNLTGKRFFSVEWAPLKHFAINSSFKFLQASKCEVSAQRLDRPINAILIPLRGALRSFKFSSFQFLQQAGPHCRVFLTKPLSLKHKLFFNFSSASLLPNQAYFGFLAQPSTGKSWSSFFKYKFINVKFKRRSRFRRFFYKKYFSALPRIYGCGPAKKSRFRFHMQVFLWRRRRLPKRLRTPFWIRRRRRRKWHRYWRISTRKKKQKSRRFIGKIRRFVFRKDILRKRRNYVRARRLRSLLFLVRNPAAGRWWRRGRSWPFWPRRRRPSPMEGYTAYMRSTTSQFVLLSLFLLDPLKSKTDFWIPRYSRGFRLNFDDSLLELQKLGVLVLFDWALRPVFKPTVITKSYTYWAPWFRFVLVKNSTLNPMLFNYLFLNRPDVSGRIV